MIDAITHKPLEVHNHGSAGPYLMLPVSQLDEACRLLDKHGVRYVVDEDYISIDEEPETVFVDFGREADAAMIKAILNESRSGKDA